MRNWIKLLTVLLWGVPYLIWRALGKINCLLNHRAYWEVMGNWTNPYGKFGACRKCNRYFGW